jgi:hypothetical protein
VKRPGEFPAFSVQSAELTLPWRCSVFMLAGRTGGNSMAKHILGISAWYHDSAYDSHPNSAANLLYAQAIVEVLPWKSLWHGMPVREDAVP